MPRTDNVKSLDIAISNGTIIMRADIADREVLVRDAEDNQRFAFYFRLSKDNANFHGSCIAEFLNDIRRHLHGRRHFTPYGRLMIRLRV